MSVANGSSKKGVLYIIATPIGNLGDITVRAQQIIAGLDCLYAEDTRHTGQLCRHLGLNPTMRSLHEHNEAGRIEEILLRLRAGDQLGLVSDAGTPLISDPGYRIVAACHEQGLQVSPIPGASALIAALSVCGLPTDKFTFRGFLPSRAAARRVVLAELIDYPLTTIFYESRHRVVESLADIASVLGAARRICVAREISKTFETILLGEVAELQRQIGDNADWQKGEFVFVVEGVQQKTASFSLQVQTLLLELNCELPPRKAVSIVSKHTGVDKKTLYDWLIEQKQ